MALDGESPTVDLDALLDPWADEEDLRSPGPSQPRTASPPRLPSPPTSKPFRTAPLTGHKLAPADKGKGKQSSPLSTTRSTTLPRAQSHPLALSDAAEYAYGAYGHGQAPSRNGSVPRRERSGSSVPPMEMDKDVSRPALARLASETEKALSHGSWSAASRSDGGEEEAEGEGVEVVVHRVTPSDSLPGISLRYGIELSALRKANKLWPSDPIYLRTQLYIPLEAANVTREGDFVVLKRQHDTTRDPDSGPRNGNGEGSPTPNGNRNSDATLDGKELERDSDERLEIIRLSASKLRFFPSSAPSASRTPRASFDDDASPRSKPRRTIVKHRPPVFPPVPQETDLNLSRLSLSGLTSGLSTVASAFTETKPKVVKLRPPSSVPAKPPPSNPLAARLQRFFDVAPPPADWAPVAVDGRRVSEPVTPRPRTPELVEMDMRVRSRRGERRTDKKRD